MMPVKMGAKHEHEYLANYKVIQKIFNSHSINKSIPTSL